MLNQFVQYNNEPEAVAVMELPDGSVDVWLRKGVNSVQQTDEGGGTYTAYQADEEAYGRFQADQVPDAAEDFDAAFEVVAAWQPPTPPDAKLDPLNDLRAQVSNLAAQNALLTECILEMSEAVYA